MRNIVSLMDPLVPHIFSNETIHKIANISIVDITHVTGNSVTNKEIIIAVMYCHTVVPEVL